MSMSTLENELQDLREKNNELVKKLQYWKMTAAQRENEKLELMKETNELRLKLSRLRSGGAAHARKLDVEIQSASEQALSHLVQASNAVTRTVQLVKTYMSDRQELENALPRWSSISNTPSTERVHRVPPMMIGGQSIQPVVSLSRTMINLNNMRTSRSPNNNQNRSFPERAVPMHVLQDLYIPLTRIDANDPVLMNMDTDDGEVNNNSEDLGLDDSTEDNLQESQNISERDEFDDTPRLDVVAEDMEPEDQEQPSPRPRSENPLEGPSWMLDGPSKTRKTKSRVNLEPDSTTECDSAQDSPQPGPSHSNQRNIECNQAPLSVSLRCEYTPTVRRRKRTSSPPPSPSTPHSYSPRPAHRRNSNNGRILKVLVSKLRLDEDDVTPPKRPSVDRSNQQSPGDSPSNQSGTSNDSIDNSPKVPRDGSPTKRQSRDVHLLSFDAPSPNGATSHLIVSESIITPDAGGSGEPSVVARKISKRDKRASRDKSHDNRTSRDKSHDNRTSREHRHDNRTNKSHDRTTRDRSNGNGDGSHDGRESGRGVDNQSLASNDSDSASGGEQAGEGRTRRPRKAITYKEKPLNRKMRR